MREREYKRLTRARRRPGFAAVVAPHSSLWLGKDHLLCIDTNGYSESYKRFYFRDIQAIVLCKTRRRLIWNWVLGIVTTSCLAGWGYDLLAGSTMELVGIVTGTIVTSVFAVPLVINSLLGPTCDCHLQTAVQTEYLPALSRIRSVRKLLNRIRPLIEEAQGTVAPDEIASRMREQFAPTNPPEQPIS